MSCNFNQRPPLRIHPAPITHPLARLWAAAVVWWLRLRVRSARDECAQLLEVWDWIPEQLANHRRQIRRWNEQADALDNRLLGLQDSTRPPSTLTPHTPSTQPAPLR